MQIRTLFSGSRGNCALLTTATTAVLIDCGVSYRSLTAALRQVGYTPRQINAIFVTHSHSDHVGGLHRFLSYNSEVDVFVHQDGCNEFMYATDWQPRVFKDEFTYRDLKVNFYRCSHDVNCCVGYSFETENKRICYITDTGVVNDELIEFVKGCDSLVIESNHDTSMLSEGIYPYYLKQRIKGVHGHLSNAQAAGLLEAVLGYGTEKIILAHLSQNNNLPQIAYECAAEVVRRLGVAATIYVATQNGTSEVI